MNKSNKVNKILVLCTSFQTILLGIVFIIQILRIYFNNNQVFTKEICTQYILEILPVLILWILLIIGSFIYFNISDIKYKNISKISNVTKQKNLERICPEINDKTLKYELICIERSKKIAKCILIIILIISSYMSISYLLNTKHFDPSGDLFKQATLLSLHLMPWVIITFVAFIGYAVFEEYKSKKACKVLLEIIKTNGKVSYTVTESKKKLLIKNIIQLGILCIAVVLIIIGINNGGANDTLQKAINICTECIGLG